MVYYLQNAAKKYDIIQSINIITYITIVKNFLFGGVNLLELLLCDFIDKQLIMKIHNNTSISSISTNNSGRMALQNRIFTIVPQTNNSIYTIDNLFSRKDFIK